MPALSRKHSPRVRTLIIDDEPLARERIRTLLRHEQEIEIVGECGNGLAAITAITTQQPDLIFLDVQMPELSGFEVLEALEPGQIPFVIFVTAYDQYALRAFEVHALDYLLKPFDRERFHKALQRAVTLLQHIHDVDFHQRLHTLLQQTGPQPKSLTRLVIKNSGRVFFLKTDDIDWLEAAGNYVRLHTGVDSHLLRETIKTMESRLDPEKFLRVSRSAIVNIDRLLEMQPWFNGEYLILLKNGGRVTSSRGYRAKIDALLSK